MVIDADVSVCCGVNAPVLTLQLLRASAVLVEGETCSSEGEVTQRVEGELNSRKEPRTGAMVKVEVVVGVHRNSCRRRRIYYSGPFKFPRHVANVRLRKRG
jgi:hypothetical protein